jgi:hypothetical protein
MEAIQDEYGTLDNWGALTDGKAHEGETDIKALIFGLREMLNEAIEIDNEDNGTNEPLLTRKQVGRMLTDIGIGKLTNDMNKLVVDSTKNDNESKNE